MTQEQRDLLQKELSDFQGRKIYNRSETWLLYSENRCIPFEEVKKNYESYLKYGCSATAKSLGISNKSLLDRFDFYGLKKVYVNHKQYKVSDKIKDIQKLTCKEWCDKYNDLSGNYYRGKKRLEKYLKEQGSVDT
jgi:hypothetical protein